MEQARMQCMETGIILRIKKKVAVLKDARLIAVDITWERMIGIWRNNNKLHEGRTPQ